MKKAICFCIALTSLVLFSQASLQGQGKVVPAAAELSRLDQPLAWMHEAKRNYSVVKDYSCTMVSQEHVRGKLLDENIMQMKVKTEPFSVYMRWLAPAKFKEQEVAFALGKNGNKMRVKSNVLGNKLIGWISLDANDPRVFENSRHSILEAGIGNLIDTTLRNWERERLIGKTDVRVSESSYNKRDCYRIETICPERPS